MTWYTIAIGIFIGIMFIVCGIGWFIRKANEGADEIMDEHMTEWDEFWEENTTGI